LDDFEALVREIDVRALVLENHSKSIRTSARISISRITMRSRNVILKVSEFKKILFSRWQFVLVHLLKCCLSVERRFNLFSIDEIKSD
jgi:hypothetical protein